MGGRSEVRALLAGGDESMWEKKEEVRRKGESEARKREVEKWLRGGGGQE